MAGPGKVFEDIKARIYDKFIQYFVITRGEIIDQPGFIICRFTSGPNDVSLREFVFPESLFSKLEQEVVKKFGDKGAKTLYSAGKRFGYRYANISGLAKINEMNPRSFKSELYAAVRYMETIYAEGIRHTINTKNKLFEAELNQYVVCRLNGLGHILTEGAVAGTLAYMLGDNSIEGTQVKCQGRGDKLCKIVCAPKSVLKKIGIEFFEETNYADLKISTSYSKMNEVQKCKFGAPSFKSLVDAGFYKYTPGVAKFGSERYVFCEASILYLIEMGLEKINAKKLMFDVAFGVGKKIGEEHTSYGPGFLGDYLSSLGYGDVQQIGASEISIDYFPWTKYVAETEFTLIRGLVSGLLSGLNGKKIILKEVTYSENGGFLNLVIR